MPRQEPSGSETPAAANAARAQDLALIRRVRRGDRAAVDELARRLSMVPRVLAAINRRHGGRLSEHDIEDLTQDTLQAIWVRLSDFNGRSRIETWAYAFCANTFANAARKSERRGRRRIDVEDAPQGEVVPEDPFRYEDVHAAIEQLGSPRADVIRLRVFEGMAFADIAEDLAAPVATVKTWFHRGLKELAGRLTMGGEG